MAGDWVKIEHATPDKPEIDAMANALGIDHDAVFGKCVRLWVWVDQQSVDGDALSVTKTFIDRLVRYDGFADAMIGAGWLTVENDKFSIPNFDRHNGQTAKTRGLTNKRMKRYRNATSVTKSSPEKRREELNPSGEKKKRMPDEVWDAVEELFFPSGVAPSEKTRVGKIVRDLKAKSATPDQIRSRHNAARAQWDKPFGPEALVKNWDTIKSTATDGCPDPANREDWWKDEDGTWIRKDTAEYGRRVIAFERRRRERNGSL